MSIYASIAGIDDMPDDDYPHGPPWLYQGSGVVPAESDPRGGELGLAQIPSHITPDGRDDGPDDGPPWPWLRVHIAVPGDDPTVLITPAQARALAADLTTWADRTEQQPEHRYLSTSCLHDRHERCAAPTGSNDRGETWAKKPSTCKFCDARCVCPCHRKDTPTVSYDIWLDAYVPTGGPDLHKIDVADVGNYTSNVAPMWAQALGRPLRDLDGARAGDTLDDLRKAVTAMESDPGAYQAMNPTNGWGDYDGALTYLRELRDACAIHPNAQICISH